MTSRKILSAGLFVVLGGGILFLVLHQSPPPDRASVPKTRDSRAEPQLIHSSQSGILPVAIPARRDVDGQPALSPPDPDELTTKEVPPLAAVLGRVDTKPEDEPKVVLNLLNIYRRLLGAYPSGENNSQFVNALLGANKEKLPFLPPNHPRINAQGEIVDAWGTPFFFHLNSRVSVEVRSAGPDRHFFTADDIVAGAPPELHGQFEPDSGNTPTP